MCGIVGIVPREPGDPSALEAHVRRMADAIEHRGPVSSVLFEPSGELLLTTSDDRAVRFWSVVTGEQVQAPLRRFRMNLFGEQSLEVIS